jgi:hypothetical protein
MDSVSSHPMKLRKGKTQKISFSIDGLNLGTPIEKLRNFLTMKRAIVSRDFPIFEWP